MDSSTTRVPVVSWEDTAAGVSRPHVIMQAAGPAKATPCAAGPSISAPSLLIACMVGRGFCAAAASGLCQQLSSSRHTDCRGC